MLGAGGGEQNLGDVEIIDAPPVTLPSIAELPEPELGPDYTPANTVPSNTVPFSDQSGFSNPENFTHVNTLHYNALVS